MTLNNPIPLPSLDYCDAEDKKRESAFSSLEFVNKKKDKYVKCQNPSCHKPIKIVGKLQKPHNDKVEVRKKRIRYAEAYSLVKNNNNSNEIKELKRELEELEKEEEKRDKLRSLPLVSSRSTGYRFYCHDCWNNAHLIYEQERRKKKVI